jgi:serine/threonine protein kinase
VERELGRGAMGVIYKAEDPDIGRTVAIKLVRADLLESDDREDFLARFRHEARAAGRCTHPNIVALYDFAMHEGNPFIAMEFVDGVGLGQALKQAGRFAPADAVAIAGQVLEGLGAAHALGVVHRDVKPANIMVLPNGRVKVTDFGISRLNTSDLTQDGAVVGTPAYMSPEQCRGDDVDQRSDLFSVGSVLYELLSGVRAFSGRNITEVTTHLLSEDPRDLTEVAPDVPAGLAAVLRRAMAKSRDARYASAEAMADALRAAIRDDASAADNAAGGDRTVMMPRPATAPATFDDARLSTIERRLARHVGPIARHLVRDAARRTNSIDALCEAVAQNIAPTAERQRFLAESLDGSPGRSDFSLTRAGTSRHTATSASPAVTSPGVTSPGVTSPGVAPATAAPGTLASATGSGFSAAQIERAERALTVALGPIAKLMVKRALPGAASEAVLWERLAAHIQRPADREAFLRQKPNR